MTKIRVFAILRRVLRTYYYRSYELLVSSLTTMGRHADESSVSGHSEVSCTRQMPGWYVNYRTSLSPGKWVILQLLSHLFNANWPKFYSILNTDEHHVKKYFLSIPPSLHLYIVNRACFLLKLLPSFLWIICKICRHNCFCGKCEKLLTGCNHFGVNW